MLFSDHVGAGREQVWHSETAHERLPAGRAVLVIAGLSALSWIVVIVIAAALARF